MRKMFFAAVTLAVASIAVVALTRAEEKNHDTGAGSGAVIGSAAPQFSLSDQDGKTVSLKDFAGKIVVVEWTNPHCPFVLRHYKAKTMQTLAAQYKDKDVQWLAINSTKETTNESDKQWAADQAISYPVLNDVATAAGKAYHATNTPEMFIVGKDGTLLYKGAIDNDPEGERTEGKVNYVQKALDEILAGKPVTEPETKPYGCGVHYQN